MNLNYLDNLLVLQSCWRAFEETMKANGMSEKEIEVFTSKLWENGTYRVVREVFIELKENE